MRIAIDAMGTDLGPAEIVKGVVRASIELQACGRAVYTLVGDENTLLSELQSLDVACGTIRIQHASEVIGMHAQPSRAIRGNNSILVAAKMAASGEADAFVSLGNTGAAMGVAQRVFGMIPGVTTDRPPIVLDLPRREGYFTALDMGANITCTPDQLLTFALLGRAYAEVMRGVKDPKVGLISNGSEPSKGTEVIKDAHKLLNENLHDAFIGNIEPNTAFVPGPADVVVCDGFTGNMILKTGEGAAILTIEMVKAALAQNWWDKLVLGPYRRRLQTLKGRLGYESFGGAPLLGVCGVAIVGHGSSTAAAVVNAVRVAEQTVKAGLPDRLAGALRK